jgi:serine/threonine-protein kinase
VERLGRYALLEPLGEGGMARVFLARRDGSNEICVLKRMHAHIEANDLAAKRFHREAHIASLLSHHAIARVLDAGLEGDSFCIAMEHIAGQTVEQILLELQKKSRLLSLEHALLIAEQTLEALAYAHDFSEDGRALNIVHRDLSPRNIMASYAGDVKIIDFGIARGDVDGLKTAPGVLMGTPYYMSPEQARTAAVDRRSDLYTFGAVLFEMFTNRRLVRAKGRAAILAEVAMTPAPVISQIDPRIPKSFDPFFARILAKDPHERPADARAMLSELRAASGSLRPANATALSELMTELFPTASLSDRTAVVSLAEPTRLETTAPPPAPPKKTRRSPVLMIVLGAAVAASGIGMALASFTGDEEPAPLAPVVTVAEPVESPKIAARPLSEETAVPKDRTIEVPKRIAQKPVEKAPRPEEVKPKEPEEPAKPVRLANVEAALSALRSAPEDPALRSRLYELIEAQARPAPEKRRRVIRAAIDRSLLDSGIEGLERGVEELRRAIALGEI